jgi:hypothetical protein
MLKDEKLAQGLFGLRYSKFLVRHSLFSFLVSDL